MAVARSSHSTKALLAFLARICYSLHTFLAEAESLFVLKLINTVVTKIANAAKRLLEAEQVITSLGIW